MGSDSFISSSWLLVTEILKFIVQDLSSSVELVVIRSVR